MEPIEQFERTQPLIDTLEHIQTEATKKFHNTLDTRGQTTDSGLEVFIDEITGLRLRTEGVRQARAEELGFCDKLGVWQRGHSIKKCLEETGKHPVPMRFLDINKGDAEREELRSRLVVMETKKRSTIAPDDISATFSATPPFEGLRVIGSMVMSSPVEKHPEDDTVMLVIDISRAHPHCGMKRTVYVKLPKECNPEEDECALLQRCMYGCRDANQQFEFKVGDVMDHLDMKRGAFSPCVFAHRANSTAAWVHGDDFVLKVQRKRVAEVVSKIGQHLLVKVRAVLGPRGDDDKQVTILNRLITWRDQKGSVAEALEIEADPRHCQLILSQLGLNTPSSRGLGTPGVKTAGVMSPGKDLPKEEVTPHRSVTMRAAFLAQDRWELKFASKEAARFMNKPNEHGAAAVKRIGRFLVEHPRVVQVLKRQPKPKRVDTYTDTNHADCPFTRKSTSCTASFLGKHCVQFTSTTQIAHTLSSGESEWNGLVKGGANGLGVQSVCRDYGEELPLALHTDSSAAKGIGSRRGAGRLKHLDTGLLWLQEHAVSYTHLTLPTSDLV